MRIEGRERHPAGEHRPSHPHVLENFEGAGMGDQSLGVGRTPLLAIDDSHAQAVAQGFAGRSQPGRAGAHDENIDVSRPGGARSGEWTQGRVHAEKPSNKM